MIKNFRFPAKSLFALVLLGIASASLAYAQPGTDRHDGD